MENILRLKIVKQHAMLVVLKNISEESINFFPNPINKNDFLNFENFDKPFHLNISNLQGQIIYSNEVKKVIVF